MSNSTFSERIATVTRKTNETHVTIRVNLDGTGKYDNNTGLGFLDHMLNLFAKHGSFDLHVSCKGDLHVDDHHSVEDTGITLGQAISKALGDKTYIARYGHAYVPMDETLARAVVDLSGRFTLHFNADFARPNVGDLATELVHHFWYSFAEHVVATLHIDVLHGTNTHHKVEAIFKAVSRALHRAVTRDSQHTELLSTKGIL